MGLTLEDKMIKKILYYSGLVILPFMGIGLDYVRDSLLKNFTQTFSTFPSRIFLVLANILMISMIIWLSVQIQKFALSKIFAVIALIAGFYIVCIPILYGYVPMLFPEFMTVAIFRPFAGAFLFIAGLINILPRKKEGNT